MHFDTKGLGQYVKSHRMVTVMTALGFLIIALVIFEAGVAVGFHQASFAYHWEDNYRNNFGDPRRMGILPGMLPNPHGAFGVIQSVDLPTFVVVSGDEPEKIVRVSSSTAIRTPRGNTDTTALTTGEMVVVIGSPSDDGTVDARLIRVQPPQPAP